MISSRFSLLVLLIALAFWLAISLPPARADEPAEDETNEEHDAAEDDEPDPDRYEPLAVPIIGGSTDIGYMFGATGMLARLQQGYDPYRWKAKVTAALSIKEGPDTVELPVHYYALAFDIPGLADGRLRLYPRVEFRRVVNAGYFGMGNESRLDDTDEATYESSEEEFRRYQYLLMLAKARLNALIALAHDFHVKVGASFRYVMPEIYEGSVLEDDNARRDPDGDPVVRGIDDHALVGLQLGLVFDNRDHEANPTKGMFHLLGVRASPGKLLGADYPFSVITMELRFFIPIIGEYLVLALRQRTDTFFGSVPVHELALRTIRGVPKQRYHGKINLLGNVELRSIFYRFSFWKQHIGIGAAAFADTGRVFADYERDTGLDGDGLGLKWGVGGGFRIQWGETRVVRGDIAYSPDREALNPDNPISWYLRIDHFF